MEKTLLFINLLNLIIMKTILLILLLLFSTVSIAQQTALFTCFILNADTVNVTVYELKYKQVKDSLIYDHMDLKKDLSYAYNSSTFFVKLPLNKYYMVVFNNGKEQRDVYITTKEATDEIGLEIEIDFSLFKSILIRYNDKKETYEFKTISH